MAYKRGDYYAVCDRCGFRYYGSELKKEWNGLWTCPSCWEPKHPQFSPPKPLNEKQKVTPHRPEPEDTFITTAITGDDL